MRRINLNWAFLLCLAPGLLAQPSPTNNPPSREITLDECIRLALEHNFEIQIELTGPRIAEYALWGSYGLYDPAFQVSATRYYSQSENYIDRNGILRLGQESESDVLGVGLSGELPTGLTYDLGLDLTSQEITGESATAGRVVDNKHIADIGFTRLTQPLLKNFWTSPRRAQIKINRGTLKISEQAVLLRMMDVTREVQQAYYELIAAQDEVKVREKALELAQQLLDENRKRVQAGVLAPLDEMQAESEVAIAKANLIVARRLVETQGNVLKNLITDNFEGWHALSLQPTEKLLALPETFDLNESWRNALAKRPDFNQARLRLENQGVQVKLALNQLYPALDLVGGYGRRGLDDFDFDGAFDDISGNRNPSYSFGAVLSVPLENRTARNSYRSSKETMKQLRLQLQQIHQLIVVQVDDAIRLAQSNFQQIPARREARLFAEAALDAEQKKLENGKSTSFVVLQLQSDLTTARSVEIRALSEYNKALATLYFSEGTILDRSKINVQFR